MRRAEANTCYAYVRDNEDEVWYGFRRVGDVKEYYYNDD